MNFAPFSSIRRAARNVRARLPSPTVPPYVSQAFGSSAAQSTVLSAGLWRKRLARVISRE